MVDYNIYNIKQLEFRLDMKINYVYIYKYIASEVPSIIYIYTYNIHIHNIYFFFFFPVPLFFRCQDTSDPAVSRCCDEENILEFWNYFRVLKIPI